MRASHCLSILKSLLQELRDPRIQVWLMAGSALLLLGIGHVRAWSGAGEGKNQAHRPASRLLVAGARLDWAESFGPAQRESRRPTLTLHATVPMTAPANLTQLQPTAPRLDLRSEMEEAAARPWKYLDRPVRQQLAASPRGPQSLKVRVAWSGDDRGNAALVAGSWKNVACSGPAAHFVIGNGSRSGDGEITALSSALSLAEGLIEITLIGRNGNPSEAQRAALGELLHHVEALTGHPLVPATPAAPSI